MINEQLKEEFVNAIKNASKSPKEEHLIKVVLNIRVSLEDMGNNKTVREHLSENLQEAIREINSTYHVISIAIGRHDVSLDDGVDITKDMFDNKKEVICATTICLGNNSSV